MDEKPNDIHRVLVTGGAGYVGSVLVPRLIREGYHVRVLDLFLFGDDVLDSVRHHFNLEILRGDMRDWRTVERAVRGCDAVIHLACVSNDPSFELDPELGKSINYDAFPPLVCLARDAGVRRFVYASSSSVYGVKQEPDVTEDLALDPLTDYSKYKALCEEILLAHREPDFIPFIVRPATVCGYSPRQRLDLVVNIMVTNAMVRQVIPVFGGEQRRPNIHIEDMVDFYVESLRWAVERIDGRIYNVGRDNRSLLDIAESVRGIVGEMIRHEIQVEVVPTNDRRSYRVSSEKIQRELGFAARRSVEDGIRDLARAIGLAKVPRPLDEPRYYNVRTMQKWCADQASHARARRAVAA